MAAINEPLDIHGKVEANMPLDATEAGFLQLAFNRGLTAASRVARVTAEGELRIAHTTCLFDCDFNGAAAGALLNSQFNQQVTTMATQLNAGFLRFNSAASVAANIGASINSWRIFFLRDHMNLKLSGIIKHANGEVQNKNFEFGFGYYDVAANQAAAMNEFVGFRWTSTGALLAVLETSAGGAPVTVMENVNGGVPYADGLALPYDVVIGEEGADFYVSGILVASIPAQAGAPGLLKSGSYPVVVRMNHTVSAPSLAPVFDLGSVGVSSIGPSADEERNVLQVAMGRHALRAQAGVQAANGATNSVPASTTAPTTLVPNATTTAGLVGLGGFGRHTITGITAVPHTELIMCAYQNPLLPEASGANSNARMLTITDLLIGSLVVFAALTGGGFTAQWFVAFGGTGLSLATADAIGGAAIGTKSHNKMPLPIVDTLGAAAAAGAIATRTGEQGHIPLQTPIVLAPGEYLILGIRTLGAPVAVTAGGVELGYGANGYWN